MDLLVACGADGAAERAVDYYVNRKKGSRCVPYKLIMVFCLCTLTGVIANIVLHHQLDNGLVSGIIILLIAIIQIGIQTSFLVNPAGKLFESPSQDEDLEMNATLLRRILKGHIISAVDIACMILFYSLKF
eukprot:CAMPEP_0202709274 /NCGR_PEP_ID=MMETSP1385-20130828/21404_1 /ASSEMBLY_ACC=CAM_ASM_000861 /TAXON_ID=933848 /ORGANISM="Elphidium margaritaceum" /LENGTH=130 /DNA_ID=CAMNT_0049368495 /DNA_START=11 /DNA_END=403 /DNA_ORIENTATION=+